MESEIKKAERDVRRSSRDLDLALSHLEDRIDLTAMKTQRQVERAEHAIATIRKPVDTVRDFVETVRTRTSQFLGHVRALGAGLLGVARVEGGRLAHRAEESSLLAVHRLQVRSRRAAEVAKQNPRLVVLGGAAVVLSCIGLAVYLSRRKASAALRANRGSVGFGAYNGPAKIGEVRAM